jgi:hypothetical protein
MRNIKGCLAVIFTLLTLSWPFNSNGQTFSPEKFSNPPIQYWPRPLWFWNNTEVTAEGVLNLMQAMRDKCGYGGFGVVPFGKNFKPEYLSEDYLTIYGKMLEKAKELGMTVSLYDEFGFPSGSVGAFAEGDDTPRFQQKYPELTIERLDKTEETITGPMTYNKKIPEGKFLGAVAMQAFSLKRVDITEMSVDGKLRWDVPAGVWKIMIFSCVIDGVPIADYLNPEAVRKFTGMVHDVYYNRFREYFGKVIYGTFYDEPSMFHAQFRMWTSEFNEKFIKKYSFSPLSLYPAMWYDIGPDTESARNLLFGFRAELYAEGFNRVVNDWSVEHGITATGHTAPEEALVPVNSAGDLMKSFKYLDIPGIDKIGGQRPAERFYKLVSSAAYNWDKKIVMSETYGAMPDYDKPGDLNWNQIDSIAIDQYTKGINMLIPHAVWYDNTKVTYKPELSHRNPLYAGNLKYFTQFLARLNVMLQNNGRHVADIAIVYPIASLQGQHYFDDRIGPSNVDGPVDPSNEYYKAAIKEIDYIDVANWLTNTAGKDFTFLHPEVIDEKCTISPGKLNLKNQINAESYKVIIVPSCRTISVSNLRKISDFYKLGGMVIFTTRLPSKSAESGKDNEVKSLVRSIFPGGEKDPGTVKYNQMGGRACFLAHPDGENLRAVLKKNVNDFDVDYPQMASLQYIHKVIDGRNVYYFANVGGSQIRTNVILKGNMTLEEWDPHIGDIISANTKSIKNDATGLFLTSVDLDLKPYHSCFLVEADSRKQVVGSK